MRRHPQSNGRSVNARFMVRYGMRYQGLITIILLAVRGRVRLASSGESPPAGGGVEQNLTYRFGMRREESAPCLVVRKARRRAAAAMPEAQPVVHLGLGDPHPLGSSMLGEHDDLRHPLRIRQGSKPPSSVLNRSASRETGGHISWRWYRHGASDAAAPTPNPRETRSGDERRIDRRSLNKRRLDFTRNERSRRVWCQL